PEGITFTIHGMTAEGDRVAVEAESLGRHVSGKMYNNKYHFLAQLRDGKITRWTEYCDTELITDILCGGQRPEGTA
ncbi:MAG TPA: nuclear transport factor 2 family protein, partial [Pedomonas sp.]